VIFLFYSTVDQLKTHHVCVLHESEFIIFSSSCELTIDADSSIEEEKEPITTKAHVPTIPIRIARRATLAIIFGIIFFLDFIYLF